VLSENVIGVYVTSPSDQKTDEKSKAAAS